MDNKTLKQTAVALSAVVALAGTTALPAAAAQVVDTPLQLAACNPCNPCNPCASANPCNPCSPCNPCNPCAAANPCNPCNPCKAD